jgi:hypothetical protein
MTENNLLKTSLSNLETIANKETGYIKTQLTACGYADWLPNESEDQEQVHRVFAMAINEAIQNKLVLTKVNTVKIQEKYLRQLLGIDESTSLCPAYFTSLQNIENASSPLDMAEHINDVSDDLVKNLIQGQFKIKWNTLTGEPKNYTFHEFCDKEKTTKFFKSYDPRRAHVEATLYKECRRKNVVDLKAITKRELCPKVYIRTANGWKTWNAATNTFANCEDSSEWMNASIKTIIEENADEQTDDESKLKESLMKRTLYWAVVDDTDFKRGDKLKLEPIGRTQVYVGKAMRGIKGRWIADGRSHCEMMKKCLDNVCAMTTYDPLRLEGIQLVDARLALAKVTEEKTALFVIKTFGDDVEKVEIALQKIQKAEASLESLPEANATIEEAKKSLSEASESCRQYFIKTSLLQAYESCHEVIDAAKKSLLEDCKSCCEFLTNAQNNLYEAEKCLRIFIFYSKVQESLRHVKTAKHFATTTLQQLNEEVKKRMHEWYEETAKKELEEAEKRHRHGKRVDNTEIIHDDDIKWLPKDMKYGMNKI